MTGPIQKFGFQKEFLKNVGSVLNFKSAGEAEIIQKKHLDGDRNKIPVLLMMDVIHGYRTIYPIPLALGASFNILWADPMSLSARTTIIWVR